MTENRSERINSQQRGYNPINIRDYGISLVVNSKIARFSECVKSQYFPLAPLKIKYIKVDSGCDILISDKLKMHPFSYTTCGYCMGMQLSRVIIPV